MGCLCENPQKNPWIGAVLEEVLRRWGLEAHHLGHRLEIWIEIGMEGSVVVVDRAIRVFQAIACEHANHRCSSRNFVFALEQAGHRCCTGWFAEDSFSTTKKLVGIDDFLIRHVEKGPITGFTYSHRFGAIDGVTNPNGGGDGVWITHGGVVNQGR